MKHSSTVVAVCALVVTATLAHASWTVPSQGPAITGTPSDVVSVDAGHVTLVTPGAAWEVVNQTEVTSPLSVLSLASAWSHDGCLGAMDQLGFVGGRGGCGVGSNGLDTPIDSSAFRARVSQTGRGWACSAYSQPFAAIDTNFDRFIYAPVSWTSAWNLLSGTLPGRCRGMAILSVGGTEYALFAVNDPTAPTDTNVSLARDGAFLYATGTPQTPSVAPISVSLVGGGGVALRAFAVDSQGALVTSAIDGGFSPWEPVSVPAGGVRFRAVSLYQTQSERFGMALVELSDGSVRLYSAVPDPDPAHFGRSFRPSTAPPLTVGTLRTVDCSSASACAAITDGSGNAAVGVYVNAQPPRMPFAPDASVAEGQPVSVSVTASDDDGDAVWVRWNTPPAELQAVIADGGLVATFTPSLPGPICDGGVPYTMTLHAEDGRQGHLSDAGTFHLLVTRSAPALPPGLSPSSLSFAAGDPASTVTVVPNDCAEFSYAWDTGSDAGVVITPTADGRSAVVQPPMHLCVAEGVTETFTVTPVAPTGASDAGVLTVQVAPWGPPESPFVSDAGTQLAGTTQRWTRTATHVCDGVGPVPLETRWFVDGALPASVELLPPAIGGRITSPTIDVQSQDACSDDSLRLVAQNVVLGDGGTASPLSSLDITFVPDFDALDAGVLTLSAGSTPPWEGSVDITGINCVEARALTANVRLQSDAGVHQTVTTAIPGAFRFDPVVTCDARAFQIRAELEGGGMAPSSPLEFTTEGGAPALGELETPPLTASCDSGAVVANASLRHLPAAGACVDQVITWSQSGGPSLEGVPLQGQDVIAQARASRWDELVGHRAHLDVQARAGPQTSPSIQVTLPVVVDATFVEASLSTDVPATAQGGVVGLRARLRNVSGCAARGIRWTFTLHGLDPAGTHAQVSGALRTLVRDGDQVSVDGIDLGPGEEAVVTLNARSRLLGRAAPIGVATLNGEAISQHVTLGTAQTSGCGCQSMPVGPVALFAIAALTLRRRKSAPRA